MGGEIFPCLLINQSVRLRTAITTVTIIVNTEQLLPAEDQKWINKITAQLKEEGAQSVEITAHSVTVYIPIKDGDEPFRDLIETMAGIEQLNQLV